MKGFFLGAALAVTCCTGVGAAWADTASGGTVSLMAFNDYERQIGILSKFDPAAGTLTAITFTYSYGFNANETVTASSNASGTVSTGSGLDYESSDTAIQAVLDSAVNKTSAQFGSSRLTSAAFNLQGTTAAFNLTAGQSGNYASTASSALTASATGASTLAAFSATANSTTFDLYGRTLTGLNLLVSGGNVNGAQSTTSTASFGVAYTYTPAATAAVPEPATWATMLAGFGMVGVALRRRCLRVRLG